jgi:hypothetical protein
MATKVEVEQFLKELNEKIRFFEISFRPRLKNLQGVEVYIKISKGLENKPADCMSFHPAEFPMTYPLKNE